MKIKIKTILTNNKNIPFMGIGVVWLLEKTIKYGSLNAAAKDMKMSYSKAIKIIRNLEKNLNQKILISKIGGKKGGESKLTNFAINFLNKFRFLENKIQNYGKKNFNIFFKQITKYKRT